MPPAQGRFHPKPIESTRFLPTSVVCRLRGALLAPLLGSLVCGSASSQDLMAPIVTAPSGVESVPGMTAGARNLGAGDVDFFDGVTFGAEGSLYYDSNIFQGDDGLLGPIEDDMIFLIRPYVAYQNPGGDFTFGGRIAIDHTTYFSDRDLGGFGYNWALNTKYQGGKIIFTGDFGSSLVYGTNRDFNNAFIKTLNFNTRLGLNYKLSPKSSIDSRLGYSWTEPDGSTLSSTYNTNFDVSALWRYSALTTFGPGIAWTQQGGDRQSDRTTIGPILRVDYRLAQKVALDGTFGLEFVDSGGPGGSDTAFSTRLGVSYQASRLWGMNLSVYKGTDANGGAGSPFRDTFSIRTGYNHKIRRARLNLGLAYEMSSAEGLGAALDPDRDYLNFDSSIGMPVFWNRATASIFYAWRQETGGREYDGHRFGLSMAADF